MSKLRKCILKTMEIVQNPNTPTWDRYCCNAISTAAFFVEPDWDKAQILKMEAKELLNKLKPKNIGHDDPWWSSFGFRFHIGDPDSEQAQRAVHIRLVALGFVLAMIESDEADAQAKN